MEPIGNASFGGEIYHSVHHVARTGHAEAYVACAVKHHVGCLHEVFRPLLHGYASEEGHNLFLAAMVWAHNVGKLLLQGIHSIVYSEHFAWVLMILVDYGLARKLAHTHDAVSPVHTVLLYRVHRRVYLAAASVEVGGVYVYAKRFAAHLLGVYSCRISEPVVGVDDVIFLRPSHHSCHDGVVVYLLVKVVRVASGELHAPQIVHVHVVEVGIYVVAQSIVVVRTHHVAHTTLHVFIVNVAPCYRHSVHCHNVSVSLVFVAPRFGQTESYLYVTLSVQSLGYSKARRAETAEDMRRIFPTEH